jgi:hypothetical protein
MKQILTIIILFNFWNVKSQELFDNPKLIQEINFFYQDTAINEFAYGDYKPTSVIGLNNGSLLISTIFSISFPNQYKTPSDYNSEYFERQNVYAEKSHVSSGSIFKLSKDFEKEWETVFKDKRLNKINLLKDSTIIAVGEKVEMNKFWVALLDLNGKIIWEKEFRNKMETYVSDAVLDSLDNLYILLESERLIPIQKKLYEFGVKRIEFFKTAEMDADLYLTKISRKGKRLWTKTLDKRKNFNVFAYNLIIGKQRIIASSSYEGFKKNVKYEGKNIFELNFDGKLLNKYETKNNGLLFFENGYISCSSTGDDTLKIFQNSNNNLELINEINLPREINHFWIKKGISLYDTNYIFGSSNHNLGYLLLKLDKNYNFKGYWINSGDMTCQSVDFTILEDSSIIIVGEKWIKINDKSVRFINLKRIKNGA